MSREICPVAARAFAVEVVRKLRDAGHQALWAGGCVRDQLLAQTPKDYDVATSARPEQVREVFGRKKTLAVGAAFGVISVLGPREAGQIDVATFRKDAGYSDGRHPDSVSFSDDREDAQRRDFTINGLFFDPLEQRVIDYVGGQEDLSQGVIRAIGDPRQRIAEDKLRMLRAVRFAATFAFEIDPATLVAVREQAHELVIVSAERIAAEMKRMLVHPHRVRALRDLHRTGLLEVVLPEIRLIEPQDDESLSAGGPWARTLAVAARLESPAFPTALAALLREIALASDLSPAELGATVCRRWKLSTDELEDVCSLLRDEPLVRRASSLTWPQVQQLICAAHAEELLKLAHASAEVCDGADDEIRFCRRMLGLPPAVVNPPPLITGNDLKTLGLPPGPIFRTLLDAVRTAQLESLIDNREDALAFAQRMRLALETDR